MKVVIIAQTGSTQLFTARNGRRFQRKNDCKSSSVQSPKIQFTLWQPFERKKGVLLDGRLHARVDKQPVEKAIMFNPDTILVGLSAQMIFVILLTFVPPTVTA
jgi:hypothetical protein